MDKEKLKELKELKRLLKVAGISQDSIASLIVPPVERTTVCRVLNGQCTSSRIESFIKSLLGVQNENN